MKKLGKKWWNGLGWGLLIGIILGIIIMIHGCSSEKYVKEQSKSEMDWIDSVMSEQMEDSLKSGYYMYYIDSLTFPPTDTIP